MISYWIVCWQFPTKSFFWWWIMLVQSYWNVVNIIRKTCQYYKVLYSNIFIEAMWSFLIFKVSDVLQCYAIVPSYIMLSFIRICQSWIETLHELFISVGMLLTHACSLKIVCRSNHGSLKLRTLNWLILFHCLNVSYMELNVFPSSFCVLLGVATFGILIN